MAETQQRHSIRRELLVLLLASVAAIWIGTAIFSYLDARHEIDELLDAHLTQTAALLMTRESHDESDEVDEEHAPLLHRYGRRVAFQRWENGTTLRLHSANAPETPLSSKQNGFSDTEIDGRRWRVFSAWDAQRRSLVQVGEQLDKRGEIAATMAKNMLLPLALALPLLGLLIWLGIQRATRPLRQLIGEIERRAPDNLAPLDVGNAPVEVAPLVANLNRLFGKVAASIDDERRFTADAAHELRTPLAAVRAQAQVARGSSESVERDRALDNVVAGCDRASHLMDQLLTLARLEPDSFQAKREPCDLHAAARLQMAAMAPSALTRAIELELEDGPPVRVSGNAPLLEILLRNLVDNAIRYSPPDTTVRVTVGERGGSPFLRVADEGPGVPADERGGLGRRFHRLADAGTSGSGLGLSIVKRIAELHDAAVVFAAAGPAGGLAVEVSFPVVTVNTPPRDTGDACE